MPFDKNGRFVFPENDDPWDNFQKRKRESNEKMVKEVSRNHPQEKTSLEMDEITTPQPDPVTIDMAEPPKESGGMLQGIKKFFGGVNNNVIEPVKNFFNSPTISEPSSSEGDSLVNLTDSLDQKIGEIGKGFVGQMREMANKSPLTRGFSDPNLQDKNWLDQTGASLRGGTAETIKGYGSTAEWLGFHNLAADMKKYGEESGKGFEAPPREEFTWSTLLDPSFYSTTVARSIPNTATAMAFAPAGAEAAGLLTAVKFVKNASPFVKLLIKSTGAGAASGSLEAALEAGYGYEDARSRGMSEEEAHEAANGIFKKNLALLMATNSLEFATAFAPIGKLGKLGKAAAIPAKIGGSVLQEGGEEALQDVITRSELGDPIAWDAQMKESFAVGGLFGAAFGGFGALTTLERNVDSIRNRVIEKMDDETRADYTEALADAKAQGIPEAEAVEQILVTLAQTPKGQQHVTEALQEVAQSEQMQQEVIQPSSSTSEHMTEEEIDSAISQIPQESSEELAPEIPKVSVEDFTQQAIANLDARIAELDSQKQQPVTAPTKPSTAPVVENGQTVNLKGKGTQKFTVTGTKGDFVSLRSEHGGEIPQVHKSALIPFNSDSGQQELKPVEETPAAPVKKEPEIGDIVTTRGTFNKKADDTFTVIGDLGKGQIKLRDENGKETTINKAAITGFHGKQTISEEDNTRMAAQAEFDGMKRHFITDGGKWKPTTKLNHLNKMQQFAEENGIEMPERLQTDLRAILEPKADQYKNRQRKGPDESWQDAAKHMSDMELYQELEGVGMDDLRTLRDELGIPKSKAFKNMLAGQIAEHLSNQNNERRPKTITGEDLRKIKVGDHITAARATAFDADGKATHWRYFSGTAKEIVDGGSKEALPFINVEYRDHYTDMEPKENLVSYADIDKWTPAPEQKSEQAEVQPKANEKQKAVQASNRTDNNLTQQVYIQDGKVKIVSKVKNLDHELLPRGFDADSVKMLSHSFDLADYQKAEKSHGNPHWARKEFIKKQLEYDKIMEKHGHSPLIERILDSQISAVKDAIAKLETTLEDKAPVSEGNPVEQEKKERIKYDPAPAGITQEEYDDIQLGDVVTFAQHVKTHADGTKKYQHIKGPVVEILEDTAAGRVPVFQHVREFNETTVNEQLMPNEMDQIVSVEKKAVDEKKQDPQHNFDKLYFAVNPNSDEIEAVKQAQPKNVLLSFARWGNKNIKDNFIDLIGYRPENIIIDSGAFSFKGKDVGLGTIFDMYAEEADDFEPSVVAQQVKYDLYALDQQPDSTFNKAGKPQELPLFHKYIEFLDANRANIDSVMTLDDMNDPAASLFSFQVMQELGYNLVPVFHYGNDKTFLTQYVDAGADYIALGGSVGVTENDRATWAKEIVASYPNVKFHLLGTNNQRLIDKIPRLYSADGTTWHRAGREGKNGTEERAQSGAEQIKKREQKVEDRKKKGEEPDATGTMGLDGEKTLEGTLSGDVQGAASEGTTGSSSGSSAGTNEGRVSEPNTHGDGLSNSVGDSTDHVDLPAGRNEPERSVTPITGNYVITDDDLGIKGKKTSYKANVKAIKLMKQIVAEGRVATPEEQKVLVQYVGWGGIAEPFSPSYKMPPEWAEEAKELREILTSDEWEFVADTILNAHYTSVPVIRAVYEGLRHLGFESGRILEPSMGAGHFLGLMPSDIASRSRITGIEIDPITGNIAKLLYPKADIRVQGFEETKIADGFYDVVVGNVPFGNFSITDPEYAKKGLTEAIHNYFIAKAIDKVRPGGIVMVLTSRYTMDSQETKVRRYLASKADLVGAIRLPNDAFKKNAGTSVVTDLLILQKREDGQVAKDLSWVESKPMTGIEGSYQPVWINSYYHENPSNMLGTPSMSGGGMYGGKEYTLNPVEGQDLNETMIKALQSLPDNIIPKRAKPSTEDATPKELIPAPNTVKENAFVFHGDNLYMNIDGQLQPAKVGKAAHPIIKGLMGIRDAAKNVLLSQLAENATEAQMNDARKQLNSVYDAFVKQNGPINDSKNVKLFAQDPDAYLLLALEKYDSEKNKATKTDIFSKRTVQKFTPAEKADTAEAALVVTLNEIGTVNFKRMEQLTGKPEAQLIQELKGRIYFDPSSNWWVTADDYLSGNVKAKLQAAKNLTEMDATYQENVDALLAVQPADLTKDDVDISLGAHWIPTTVYRDFASHLFDLRRDEIRIQYSNALNQWTVEIPNKSNRSWLRNSTQGNTRWGTRDYDALMLLEKILNYKSVKIVRKDSDGNKYFDKKATLAAKQKMSEITQEFDRWLYAQDNLVQDLLTEYNDRFVTDRLRTYDGSHLTFPGMNPAITLKPHQKDAVWRAVQSGNTLLAHAVGAGKTFEMIASMMEMKRLGIVNKPLWTVPNHLVEQMGADFLKLYPAANILVATKKDFEATNRKRLFAKIATGNYDAVIMAHSSFGKVPMSANTVRSFYQVQLDQLELAIEESVKGGKKSDTGLAKKIRASRKRLTEKMNKQVAKIEKDDAVSFEELGVDALIVDEAHEFKNLFYATSMTRVGGLGNTEGSGKAFDLFMKTRYLQKLNSGRGVIFATGTPVSNSLAEMYTMQRYLQYDEMVNRGVSNFDAWASQFAKITNAMELAPEGKGFRQVTKITDMVNLPELQHMFRSFADVKTADELLSKGLITRPELAGGTRTPVLVAGTDELHNFVNELADRAGKVRSGSVDPSVDNMLKIVGEGRKAALDMRLVDPSLPDNPESKVNVAVSNMVDIWKATKSYTVTDKDGKTKTLKDGTQLVFLDLSTPKAEKTDKDGNVIADDTTDASDISVYDDIRKKLIAKGVPKDQIAFIHDAKTDADKEILFRKVNNGAIRFLLGSSQKMGAGMNVQTRLAALHHLDVPWRPMDVEQREGRILRQGNENPEVSVFSYITEGSFDAYMWQLIASKAKIVDQTLNGDLTVRRRQDPSAMEMSANQIKALASGDERIVEHANLSQETQELTIQASNLQDSVNRLQMEIRYMPERGKKARSMLNLFEQDQTKAQTVPEDFTVTIEGQVYTERKAAGEKLIALQEQAKEELARGMYTEVLGKYGDFEMVFEKSDNVLGVGDRVQPYLVGKAQKYYFSIGADPVGATRSLGMALDDIDKNVMTYRKSIERLDHEIVDAQRGVDETTAKLEDVRTTLNEKTARKLELEQALDLAPSAEETLIDGNENEDEDDGDGEYNSPAVASGSVTRSTPKGKVLAQLLDTDKHIGPKTTEKVADLLANHLDTVLRDLTQKRTAEGTFNTKTGTGTVRVRSMGEWRIVGHELGHAFSHAYGDQLDLQGVSGELIALAEKMYGKGLPRTKAGKTEEGFAEFFYLYMVDPVLAETLVPQTVKMFNEFIAGNKKLANLFVNMRTIIDNDLGESNPFAKGMMAVSSNIDTSAETGHGEDYKVPWHKYLQFQTTDFVIPAKDIDNKIGDKANRIRLERILTVMGDAAAKAGISFSSITQDHEGRKITHDADGKELRPLKTIMEEAITDITKVYGWKKKKFAGLDEKMGALHILTSISLANRVKERISEGHEFLPLTEAEADAILAQARTDFPKVLDLAKEYADTLSFVIMEKMERVGLLTPEARTRINAKSHFYMPFYYDDKKVKSTRGTTADGRAVRSVVKRFSGRKAPVLNLLQATALKLNEVEQAIEFQRSLIVLDSVLKEPGMGKFGQKFNPPMKAMRISDDQIASIHEGLMDQMLDAGIDLAGFVDNNQALTLFKGGSLRDIPEMQRVVMYKNGDDVTYYKLAPDVYDMFVSMKSEKLGFILRFMNTFLNSPFRKMNLFTLTYIKGAVTRDALAAFFQSKHAVTSVSNTIPALMASIGMKNGEQLYQNFISAGGFSGAGENFYKRANRATFDEGILDVGHSGWGKVAIGGKKMITRVLKTPSEILRVIDELPRIAEFSASIKRAFKELGHDPNALWKDYLSGGTDALPLDAQEAMERILVDGAYASREVTVNFGLHGINPNFEKYARTVPFFKGTQQGMYRFARAMKNDPLPTSAKALAAMGFITLLSYLSMGDDDDMNKLQSMKDVARDKYWWFKIGDGMYLNISKPYEYSLPINLIERFIDDTYSGVEHARSTFKNWFGAAHTSFGFSWINQVLSTWMDLQAGQNAEGYKIVPLGKQNKPKDDQYDPASTSYFARNIAQGYNVGARFFSNLNGNEIENDPSVGIAPLQVDYAIKHLTNVYGDMALRGMDWADRELAGEKKTGIAGVEYWPVVGSLLYGRSEGAVRTSETFYHDKTAAMKMNAKAVSMVDEARAAKKNGTPPPSLPDFVTPENLLVLQTLPMMNAIADDLSESRKEIKAKMEKSQSPEEKRLLAIRLKYTEQVGTGYLYGVDPVITPEDAGLSVEEANKIRRHIKYAAQDAAIKEYETVGGTSENVRFLRKMYEAAHPKK